MLNNAGELKPSEEALCKVNIRSYGSYFLRLGALGFGGPIALTAQMRRDLVETKRWVSSAEFEDGLALAQLAPGPLAAQLAIYLGWVRYRNLGAALIALAFILPSFCIVLLLSMLYVRFGGLNWLQGAFYGIGASVIAIIFTGAYKLILRTVAKDKLLWVLMGISAAVTIITESEIFWIFIAAGFVSMFVRTPFSRSSTQIKVVIPPMFTTGLGVAASSEELWRILFYFSKAGAFVFGSGLAIVPFLHGGVVQEHHWLTERQFLDAVAIAMITPGPVVITVAFIGFMIAGFAGALAAAIGVFLPCFFFVIGPAPYFQKYSNQPRLRSFIAGVTSAAIGAIAGAGIVLGKRALIDMTTIAIFLLTLFCLLKVKKLPEPVLIIIAGVIGLAAQTYNG